MWLLELGLGTRKPRLHTAVPYIGQKTLSDDQQEYNDVHGFYRARVEHLFARLWQWRIVRNVWTCCATELHGHMPILLHLTQFCIHRQIRYQPYGPWPHMPESVWAHEEATMRRNMMMVFVANCVATSLVIYPSVALAT